MQECAVVNRLINNLTESAKEAEHYYSVEFPVKGFDFQYQFKIRRIGAESMCILIREDSNILKRLKVGSILTMKYRPIDAACPSDYFDTAIVNITKNREGRFKGHYLVGLKIMCGLSLVS
jgi:hypothetical protein